jgi:hypothetical protein
MFIATNFAETHSAGASPMRGILLISSRFEKSKRMVADHSQFITIASAFLILRLLLPIGFSSRGPDISDYLRWGTLADGHLYPYINYWSEYPPLFSWSVLGLYRLSTLIPAWQNDPRFWFTVIFTSTLTLFDLGSLSLVYGIGLEIGDKTRALRSATLFAIGFIIAYAASSWYDAVPLFFLLLTLYFALRNRMVWSAVAVAIGFMVKIVPVVIVPVILRRLTRLRDQVTYVVVASVTVLGLMLPFVIVGWPYVLAFFQGIFSRRAWTSIWAVLEGGYSFGAVSPLISRFSPENAGIVQPSSLPWPIIHLAFAGLFLFIYTRRINWRDPMITVAFAGLTVNLFLLWSKGFSGQFAEYAFPFILLLLPSFRGVLYAGSLSFLWVAEWPMALLVVYDITEKPDAYMVWLIMTRTVITIALCLEYARILFPRLPRVLSRASLAVVAISWISVVPVGIALVSAHAQMQLAADPARPAVELIASSDVNTKTIVFASSQTFRRLYPLLRTVGDTRMLPPTDLVPEETRVAWLRDLAAHGPFWFIADEGDTTAIRDEGRNADAWLSNHACKVDAQWAEKIKVSRFVEMNDLPVQIPIGTTFADEIQLADMRLSAQTIRPGGTLCVEFNWESSRVPSGDYTVFVHLINAQGQLVAQSDLTPQGGFAPTSSWKAGSRISDRHGLILPDSLPSGDYTISAGLYRSDNQSPVRVTEGGSLLADASGIVLTQVYVAP